MTDQNTDQAAQATPESTGTEQATTAPAATEQTTKPEPAEVIWNGTLNDAKHWATEQARGLAMTALHHAGEIVAKVANWEGKTAAEITDATLAEAEKIEAWIKARGAEASPVGDSTKN